MSRKNKKIASNSPCAPLCQKEICACKKEKCDYLYKNYSMKKWAFNLIVITICLGAIVPFGTQAVCTIWFPDVLIGLDTWNQFVSIILGLVATVLSIVSLIMGFKNYDDTLSVQEKNMSTLMEITRVADKLTRVEKAVEKITTLSGPVSITSPKISSNKWNDETEYIDVTAEKDN